ncbi:MAG: LegC family aminotransferase [Candidatus Omnitrophica bacterium]|nr:LegC family aminotransferase [Candidatus Omnitrophota bacterium]
MKPGAIDRCIAFIKSQYEGEEPVALHAPRFLGNEKKYLSDCIDSTFVSSVGKYVERFEKQCADYCGAKYAVAVVNGTAALHMALVLKGIGPGDGVITQALSFVATANAIHYTGASPVFVDVDRDTLSLSPAKLEDFLKTESVLRDGARIHKASGLRLRSCIVMHTFGHPGRMRELLRVCEHFGLVLIEDAAEGMGSFLDGRHLGTFAPIGALSFNGNKIITTGGGGMLLFDDEALARKARHLTTTAKVPHSWEYDHDAAGYNYRMPNLNAALGLAQIEQLPGFLASKRALAAAYSKFFYDEGIAFISEPAGAVANYWLNAIALGDRRERDTFLEKTNAAGVMTRPLWKLLDGLPPYQQCPRANLDNARWLEDRVVNIPSSVTRWRDGKT